VKIIYKEKFKHLELLEMSSSLDITMTKPMNP